MIGSLEKKKEYDIIHSLANSYNFQIHRLGFLKTLRILEFWHKRNLKFNHSLFLDLLSDGIEDSFFLFLQQLQLGTQALQFMHALQYLFIFCAAFFMLVF